jgi:hypothetical protein
VATKVLPEWALLKIHKAKYGSAVWLNGKPLGEHLPSFTPSFWDLRPHLSAGAENELVVRVGAGRELLPKGMPTGWDFEKYLYLPGIYDSVELILCDGRDVLNGDVSSLPRGDPVVVAIEDRFLGQVVELAILKCHEARICLQIAIPDAQDGSFTRMAVLQGRKVLGPQRDRTFAHRALVGNFTTRHSLNRHVEGAVNQLGVGYADVKPEADLFVRPKLRYTRGTQSPVKSRAHNVSLLQKSSSAVFFERSAAAARPKPFRCPWSKRRHSAPPEPLSDIAARGRPWPRIFPRIASQQMKGQYLAGRHNDIFDFES